MGAVATFTTGVEFDAATFTVGNVTGLSYDQVMELGYETVSFMPEKDSSL